MYADRHTESRLTYSISIDIHGVYVNQDTVCQSRYIYRSRYCMSIGCYASLIKSLYIDVSISFPFKVMPSSSIAIYCTVAVPT